MRTAVMVPTILASFLVLAGCPRTTEPEPEPDRASATPEPEPPREPEPPPQPEQPATETAPPLDVDSGLTKAVNALGVDLYGRLRSQPGNLAFSPMSISLAMAMTYGGARGDTARQMAKVLRFEMDAEALHAAAGRLLASVEAGGGGGELRIANRLYGEQHYTFEDPFLALTREQYRAELERTDFRGAAEQARARINGWVSEQTKNRIGEILPAGSIVQDARLVLVNAMYFKGRWATTFPAERTRPSAFHLTATESVEVPTMHLTDELRYGEVEGVHVLEMAYAGQDLAMTVLLPAERDGLPALEASLTADRIASFRAALSERRVEVSLPRFTIDPPAPISLGQTLVDLGMRLPFDASRADFTGMADPPSREDALFIGQVFHKTFVEVNEEGTEAAAATAVTTMIPGRTEPARFVADRPFLFLIHTRSSGAILFLGRVVDPRPSGASPS